MSADSHDLLDPDADEHAENNGYRTNVSRDRRLPQIEVVTRGGDEDTTSSPPRSTGSLIGWFLAAFVLVAIPVSLWNFSRPPEYRAASTVLTIVPEERSGYGGSSPDLQHVAIQRRLLLGRELLDATLAQLRDSDVSVIKHGDSADASVDATPQSLPDAPAEPIGNAAGTADTQSSEAVDAAAASLTPDDLLTMLSVEPVPETNLVEVSARGEHPTLLADIVNHWLTAYQRLREREIEAQIGGRLVKLDERAAVLEDDIQAKRAKIDAFRDRFDIVTLGSDSNEAVKRLNDLQTALATAEDESIAARAQLEALQAAIANGQDVAPDRQAQQLGQLRQQAAEARLRVEQLRERYTPMFIENDPAKRAIPELLAAIEARIAEVEREGRREALAMAREAVETTSGRVFALRRELAEQKVTASRFSSGFSEYEALTEDLTELEAMQRETEAKRVELNTTALVGYPQVEIIESAHPPRDPIAPHYWRDLGYTLGAATAAGLLTVLLLTYLDGRGRRIPHPVTGVRVWGVDQHEDDQSRLPRHRSADRIRGPSAEAASQSLLGQRAGTASLPVPRRLMAGEVEALWELAGAPERQLIGLLLCGLRVDEAALLSRESFDLAAARIEVPAPGARTVPLPPRLNEHLAAADRLPAWSAAVDSATTTEGVALEDLAHRISLLANDAGIAHADEVDADSLRDTYLIFLVRQGARLTQLELIAGPMSGAEIRRFAPYSPPGASRPLEQLDLTYPLFA
jgi:uncharacterized protein involved in exopolysaccharide biosynthesis